MSFISFRCSLLSLFLEFDKYAQGFHSIQVMEYVESELMVNELFWALIQGRSIHVLHVTTNDKYKPWYVTKYSHSAAFIRLAIRRDFCNKGLRIYIVHHCACWRDAANLRTLHEDVLCQAGSDNRLVKLNSLEKRRRTSQTIILFYFRLFLWARVIFAL